MSAVTTQSEHEFPLAGLRSQRSHVLFVMTNSTEGQQAAFLTWYRGAYLEAIRSAPGVLSARHYEQHEVDITRGRFGRRLPFHYLGLYELSVDGAETASGLIEQITEMHQQERSAQAPATWLYYPASEKVGRLHSPSPSMLVLAFANGLPGRENEFREWYATRHIRHALNISALVSGQCFERTEFQRPSALECGFSTIAIYEQVGTAEDFLASHAAVPKGSLPFPSLDLEPSRFSEWLYRPV